MVQRLISFNRQANTTVSLFHSLSHCLSSLRFQKEGVQGEACDRHHCQLHQQEHDSRGQSGGDQRCGLHLQPEVLPRPQRGDRWEKMLVLAGLI